MSIWHNSNATIWTGLRYFKNKDTVEISTNREPIIFTPGGQPQEVTMKAYGESTNITLKDDGKLLMEANYRYEMLRSYKNTPADFVNFGQSLEVIKRNKCFDPEGKLQIQDYRWWILWKTTLGDFYQNIDNILLNAEAALSKSGEKKVKIVDSLKDFVRILNKNDHYKFPRTLGICRTSVNTRSLNDTFDPLAVIFNKSKDFEEISIISRLLAACIEDDKNKSEITDLIYKHIIEYFPLFENFSEVLNSLDHEDEWNEMIRVIGFIFHLLFWNILPKKQEIIERLLDTFMNSDVDHQARFLWLTNTLMILSGNAPARWKKSVSGIDQYYDNIIRVCMPEQYELDTSQNRVPLYKDNMSNLTTQYQRWKGTERHIRSMIIKRIQSLMIKHKMNTRNQIMYEKSIAPAPAPAPVPVPRSTFKHVIEKGGMLILTKKIKTKTPVPVPVPVPVPDVKHSSYVSALSNTKTIKDAGTMTNPPPKSYIKSSMMQKPESTVLSKVNLSDMFD
tara:strand:- start:31 stop:1545 length:1515 start_codon:yes stop_codon:yes gene_type:complete